jgi:hypothetical protein
MTPHYAKGALAALAGAAAACAPTPQAPAKPSPSSSASASVATSPSAAPTAATMVEGKTPIGCYRLGADTKSAYGNQGDMLCVEAQSLIVLMTNGGWDGWHVRWENSGNEHKAVADETPSVEKLNVVCELGKGPNGLWFKTPKGLEVPLTFVGGPEAESAKARVKAVGDVSAPCRALRACESAKKSDMINVESAYSSRVCEGLKRTSNCDARP